MRFVLYVVKYIGIVLVISRVIEKNLNCMGVILVII